ncbi:MAG: Gfo/Idh/MocA family protein [Promethearchaeota archaeon]
MDSTIRWGILGCGSIAHSFALSLKEVNNAKLVAVASRTTDKAAKFATQYDVPTYFTTYEELVAYPDLDVIYIATTHNFHYGNMLLCIIHKKAILCEKAFTINHTQATEIFRLADEKNIFVMEGMWMKFLPGIQHLRQSIADGIIGNLRAIKADFGIKIPPNPENRLLNINLAGGAMLDLGVYPITFAYMLFGHAPLRITSNAFMGETGVDEESSYFLEFADNKLAMLFSSCRIETPHDATIYGTKGTIKISDFFHPSHYEWKLHGKRKWKKVDVPYDFPGYQYEIAEVNQCLQNGKIESEIMSHADTLEIMKIMDSLRRQWGFTYPEED